MNMIAERLVRLLSVKSIVTLILTVVVACLALRGDISSQELLTIFATVISFYFGTQAEKREKAAGIHAEQ